MNTTLQMKGMIELEVTKKLHDGQNIFRSETVRKLLSILISYRMELEELLSGDGRKLKAEYDIYCHNAWKEGISVMDYVMWLETQLVDRKSP